MRYLGIDYGTKRVGTALTDEGGIMAFPNQVIENNNMLLKNITMLIEDENVGKVVIGHSLDLGGKPNQVQKEIDLLKKDLEERGVMVTLEPEQFTTREASHIQGKNEKTDASAAAIILNSYLMRKRK